MFNQATIDNLTFEEKIHFNILPYNLINVVEEQVDEQLGDQKNQVEMLELRIEQLELKIKELEVTPIQKELL